MTLIEKIQRNSFPVGAIMPFIARPTNPYWKVYADMVNYDTLLKSTDNDLGMKFKGSLQLHHHATVDNLEYAYAGHIGNGYPDGSGDTRDILDKHAYPHYPSLLNNRVTGQMGSTSENRASGVYVDFYVFDPDNAIVERYDLLRYLKEQNLSVDEWLEMPSES